MSAETEQEHRLSDEGMRRFPSHERLDSMFATVGGIMKSAGGKPKSSHSLQEDLRAAENKPLSSRMLVTSMLVLVFCLLLNQVGLFVPLVIMARNCALSKVPPSVLPKYATCSDEMLANEMTIIVTVKDTCSQAPPPHSCRVRSRTLWRGPWIAGLGRAPGRMQHQQLWAHAAAAALAQQLSDSPPCPRAQLPGFLTGLERFAPPSVHLIYTFPNFKSCATIDLAPQLKYWKKVTKIPLG